MTLKRSLIVALCLCLLTGCGAPSQPADDPTDSTTTPETTEEPETTEATEPDDGSFRMYYDDRLPIETLTGQAVSNVSFADVQVASTVVGSESPDAAVLEYQDGKLLAVGCGKVTVVADGASYPVTVRPAPISLVMITGHSLGYGQCGNALQSVLCPEGQVYSSTIADNIGFPPADMGLGAKAPSRPAGIDSLTTPGQGRIGEDGGLAYEWNQLTGEKVWVLNAAVGGSCIDKWVKGESCYSNAFFLFLSAQNLLRNEIAAGHYRLKDMAILYHSGANFSTIKDPYTQQTLQMWYDQMWNGYQEGLTQDMNGDGKPESIKCLGFVPFLSGKKYENDKPATFFMSAEKSYPKMFTASTAQLQWTTDITSFPVPDYPVNQEPVAAPRMTAEMYAPDNVHLTQVAYNAMGMDIAGNLYRFLREKAPAETVTLVDSYGSELKEARTLRKGTSLLLTCLTEPGTRGDLTFSVSDNLLLSYPLEITPIGEGTGVLTVSRGDTVLLTVEFNIQ